MRKTKVLFVMIELDAGGSERVVLELARNLDPGQFDIYVAAFGGGALEKPLRKICKDIFFIDKGEGLDIGAMMQLGRVIRKTGVDVVNAHHYMPCFYSYPGSRILGRKRLIYTEHSVPEVNGVANGSHGRILSMMLFRIDAVIGVSNEIAETFRRCYPRHGDKIKTVLNGVDTGAFAGRENREAVRRQWGFSPSHFVVGTVANFRKVKNHACLVRAAARLKDTCPQARFLLVGTGFPGDLENSEDEVRALVQELGLKEFVVLAGYQEDIPEALSAMDAFCLPSFSEGLPVSILEAMSAGVPVVGSRVSGIREVVRHQDTGLLFAPDDDGDLARNLEMLVGSNVMARNLAGRALDYVETKHSNSAWAKKMSDIFLGNEMI